MSGKVGFRSIGLILTPREAVRAPPGSPRSAEARLDPQVAMAYARLGYLHAVILVNEGEKAKPYLEKAFQLSHRLSQKDRLYIKAWYALANRDNDEAIEAFRRTIAEYPYEVEAYFRLSYILSSADRFEEAADVYKRGLAIDPEAKEIYNAVGFCYSGLGRYDEAIAAHQRYVELAPDEANARDSLGLTYQAAGQYEQAIFEFNSALSLKPGFHFAVLHLGDVYFQLGRYGAAAQQYQDYLRLAPSRWNRAQGYQRLALLYLKKKDLPRAGIAARQELKYDENAWSALRVALEERDFKKAEKLKRSTLATPRLKWIQYYRGLFALKMGNEIEAIESLKEAVNHAPLLWNVDDFEDCLADAYLELRRLDDAIAEYRRLVTLNPNYPLAHYNLAQAYEQKGDSAKARASYARFLQIWNTADPDLPEVIHAKRQLEINLP